jgi:preprotein translocase subunit SecD
VQGFANTLAVGIVSSMFNALFVVKLMYDAALSRKNYKLSIGWKRVK